MEEKSNSFYIEGGTPLRGEVAINGSKNAAAPILVATLLVEESCWLENVPKIQDVENIIAVLQSMGAKVSWEGDHTVVVNSKSIEPTINEQTRVLMRRMRSSVLFLGPLLARFGEVYLPYPGGCDIGARPIYAHLDAFRDLGCEIVEEEKWIKVKKITANTPREIVLSEFSVTATENILMALAKNNEECTIHIAAAEPHVQDLTRFLQALGVTIVGIGSHDIIVQGSTKLHGARHRIIPDSIEAGTFLVAALATSGDVRIIGVVPDHLALVLRLLRQNGARIEESDSALIVRPSALSALRRVQAMPYPGIPTDLQSLFSVLATQTLGSTLIHDPLYEGRMKTLEELRKFGANIKILDEHRAIIEGPTPLLGAHTEGHDLRGTAALVVASLVAKGTSIVKGVDHIERGYEDIENKLRGLGAHIERVA